MDESQSFCEDESSTSSSDNEDFEKHLDQQQKSRKMENKKTTDKLSPLQPFKINFISTLNDLEMIDRTSKLSVLTAVSRYLAILEKVAYTVTAISAIK